MRVSRRVVPALAITLGACAAGTEPTPQAGAPAHVALVGAPLSASVASAVDVTVKVTDANGLPVPNHLVNFAVVSGGGSLFVTAVNTSAIGEAKDRWTLGTVAGEQAIEARAIDQTTGAPIVFGTVTATATPGPATQIQLGTAVSGWKLAEVGASVRFGTPVSVGSFVTRVADSYGNAIASPALVVTAAPSGWAVQGDRFTAPTTEAEGTVTFGVGTASASVRVFSVPDLRTLKLRASWACVFDYHNKLINGFPVDSTVGVMNVDSTRAVGDPGPRRGYPFFSWVEYILYAKGTSTHYYKDSGRNQVVVSAVEERDFLVMQQRKDTLLLVLAISTYQHPWDGTAPPESELEHFSLVSWASPRFQVSPRKFGPEGVGCVDYGSRGTRFLLEEY
jgi:hypothetical protein